MMDTELDDVNKEWEMHVDDVDEAWARVTEAGDVDEERSGNIVYRSVDEGDFRVDVDDWRV